MKEFDIRQEVIHQDRRSWPQVMFLGGHTDDDAMFRLTATLAEQRVGVTIATLTNSDARNLPGYQPEKLTDVRWDEAIASGKIAGVSQVRRLEIPDGKLRVYRQEGIAFSGDLVDEIKPIAIVTPHGLDAHPDHSSSHDIGVAIAGNRTPLYTTDTIEGVDLRGRPLTPDLYIPLTDEIAAIEKETYLANTSQVTNLPPSEMVDVQNVLDMTQRRGHEIGESHAAVLFDLRNTRTNPIAEILVFAKAA